MKAAQRHRLVSMLIVFTAFIPSAHGELVFEVLHRLSGSPGSASSPRSALIEATDGSLYGTTAQGGKFGDGTVFVFDPPDGFRILHSLSRPDGGNEPQAGLIEASDGNFYGTTATGGEADFGTVFKITPTGVFTTLHSFKGDDGRQPDAALMESSDGRTYGTTVTGGGSAGAGVLFRLRPSEVSPSFRRGDCNDDGAVDLSDAIFTIGSVFLGDGDRNCDEACDSNDDGNLDLSDPIATLVALFLGQGPLPLPGMNECGIDPTDDGAGCLRFERCP